jgi:hypothetical protein
MFFSRRIDSCLAITAFVPSVDVGGGHVTMPDGSNVRKTIADTVNRLQEKLLLCREDDTKSFFSLIVVSLLITCTVRAVLTVVCHCGAVFPVAALGVPTD